MTGDNDDLPKPPDRPPREPVEPRPRGDPNVPRPRPIDDPRPPRPRKTMRSTSELSGGSNAPHLLRTALC